MKGRASAETAVSLQDVDVVLEGLVGAIQRVAELVALEDHVFGPRLVGLPELRIDGSPDGPHRTRPALDPDRDSLLLADVVHADEQPLGVPPLA